VSLQFVRLLEGELAEEIAKLQQRVMNGQLTDREYVSFTSQAKGLRDAINKARELLKKFDEIDEGEEEEEGENVIPAGGRKPRR
jgi:hypothetical protein